MPRAHRRIGLDRALSKLGLLSRAKAVEAICAGRVRVDGAIVTNPAAVVAPDRANIVIDDAVASRPAWRAILFHKPRGVLTTRRDPEGRRTVYDVLGKAGMGLVAVGRSHLVLDLREGKNREARRLFEAIRHEVTRLKRVQLGGFDLGGLQPGRWRELTRANIVRAFPQCEVCRSTGSGHPERVEG